MLILTNMALVNENKVSKWPTDRFYNSLLKRFRDVKCERIIIYKYAYDKLNQTTLTKKKSQFHSLQFMD